MHLCQQPCEFVERRTALVELTCIVHRNPVAAHRVARVRRAAWTVAKTLAKTVAGSARRGRAGPEFARVEPGIGRAMRGEYAGQRVLCPGEIGGRLHGAARVARY